MEIFNVKNKKLILHYVIIVTAKSYTTAHKHFCSSSSGFLVQPTDTNPIHVILLRQLATQSHSRAFIMISEMPFFLIWSLCIKRLVHHDVYCIFLSCLLSFLCNPYIPFLNYGNFQCKEQEVDITLCNYCHC